MNRRDFMKVAAVACVMQSVPSMAADRPVRIYSDGEGEIYIAHSLDELFVWLRKQCGPDHKIPPRDDWREIDAAEAAATPIRDEDGEPAVPLSELVAEHLADGGEVPTQMATTYW